MLLSAFGVASCSLTPRIISYEQYNPNSSLIKETYVDSSEYRENLKKFNKSIEEKREKLLPRTYARALFRGSAFAITEQLKPLDERVDPWSVGLGDLEEDAKATEPDDEEKPRKSDPDDE